MKRMNTIYWTLTVLLVAHRHVNGYNRLQEIKTVDGYLNICMDGIYQKKVPGPEDLYGQCAGWKDRSCCYSNTTHLLQSQENWQGFNLSHCGTPLSKMCRVHFIQNYCFYECSPNVGPWLVKVNGMETRKERFYKVPLCKKECDLWWMDCKDDYTCVKDWLTDFNVETGTNVCPKHSSCKKFSEIYSSSTDFCQSVFDDSYEVVPMTEPCMLLSFHNTNPNDKVAKQQAESYFVNQSNCVKIEKILGVLLLGVFFFIL